MSGEIDLGVNVLNIPVYRKVEGKDSEASQQTT